MNIIQSIDNKLKCVRGLYRFLNSLLKVFKKFVNLVIVINSLWFKRDKTLKHEYDIL